MLYLPHQIAAIMDTRQGTEFHFVVLTKQMLIVRTNIQHLFQEKSLEL